MYLYPTTVHPRLLLLLLLPLLVFLSRIESIDGFRVSVDAGCSVGRLLPSSAARVGVPSSSLLGHRAGVPPGRRRRRAPAGGGGATGQPGRRRRRPPPRRPDDDVVVVDGGCGDDGRRDEGVVDDDDDDDDGVKGGGRRSFLARLSSSSCLAAAAGAGTALASTTATRRAEALPSFGGGGGGDRRQLELCLATVLRTEYWASNVARSIRTKLLLPRPPPPPTPPPPADDDNVDGNPAAAARTEETTTIIVESDYARRQPYLEARLGAKALLTQKIGGGANSRVLALGGYQLRGCLDDAGYWCAESAGRSPSKREAGRACSIDLSAASEELVESLASVVEFDGLETTIDPSPRSSLMLGMYTDQKATFVYRTLVERVVPSCERILGVFGSERRGVVEGYVGREYAEEVPFEVLERLYRQQQ